jgi:hypothetical protein
MRKIFLIAVLSFALSACVGPVINQFQLTRLDKGLSAVDVQGRLEQAPRGVVAANMGGRNFEVSRYLFNNGMQHDLYYLAYEDAKLVYWGYVSDFRRHPDKLLGQVIDYALPRFGPIK